MFSMKFILSKGFWSKGVYSDRHLLDVVLHSGQIGHGVVDLVDEEVADGRAHDQLHPDAGLDKHVFVVRQFLGDARLRGTDR